MIKLHIPDVTAYRLDEARRLLDQQGLDYYIKKPIPAGAPGATSVPCAPQNYRVVRQVLTEDGITGLLVAPEVHAYNQS